MKPRLWRLAGFAAGLTLLFSAAPAGAQQVTESAVLHRDTIVEGQARAFQISRIPTRPQYYLHASVGGAFTAEAGDVTITTNNLRGNRQSVVPDADGPRAYPDAVHGQIRFEVTANSDSDGTGDETFGMRLCTTADCAGGAVLGEWTVTVTEPAADTNVSGATGATVTIPGGSRLTMMESSANDDSRDRQATLRITLASPPTADLVLVARTGATVATGPDEEGNPTTRPIARGVGATSSDSIPAGEDSYDPASADFEVARWDSGTTSLTREARFLANDNIVDAAGGAHTGNFRFRLLVRDSNYTDDFAGNGTVHSGVTVPDVPFSVIDDDPTRVRILPATSEDSVAAEGDSSDTARFRVRVDRALAGSEELNVPLRFTGATLGTEFTISLDGSPAGASLNTTTGVLTFSGAGAREATVVVSAAADDGNTVAESLRVNIPQYSDPWHERHFDANLAGGACSGVACPNYDKDEGGQRGYVMRLVEAGPGLVIIDTGDGLLEESGTYAYSVRLNTAPSNDVTVTISHSAARKVSFVDRGVGINQDTVTLTFTTVNWQTPQNVEVHGSHPSPLSDADEPDFDVTLTHDISSSDGTYNALADVTHTLRYLDNDPTEVSLSGTGVRASPSDTNISKVMLEGDATRVDSSLTITLSRALVEGEVARIPLILQAAGHSTADGDCDTSGAGVPSGSMEHCAIVEGLRGPRISANVAWPLHHNDFVMAAAGTGVSLVGVNRYTPNYRGYRVLEFRGAGARTAQFKLHAREGFDDGEGFDEEISVRPLTPDEKAALFGTRFHAGIDTEPETPGAAAWFHIDDDEPPELAEGELVPAEWSLLPSGLAPGDQFRLIYVTSQTTAGSSGDLSTYDTFVRAEITGNDLVNGGVTDMAPYASLFKAVGGKSATAARNHAEFNPGNGEHPDVPIYWVGGSKVADNNGDFTDGNWDDEANPRTADGVMVSPHAAGYWTGSRQDGQTRGGCSGGGGRPSSGTGMGASWVWAGHLNDSTTSPLGPLGFTNGTGDVNHPICAYMYQNSQVRPMYALSGVFVVDAVAGATIENSSAAEGSAIAFTVTIPNAAPSGGITVPYTIADGRGVSGDPAYVVADSADYTTPNATSVTILQGRTSATFTVVATDDSTYESDHYFTVTLDTPTGTSAPPVDSRKGSAIGIIEDDADLPAVQFDPASVNASEADGAATLTVTRTGATLVPSSVTWTTADGTGAGGASHPGDYTSATGTVAFGAAESSKTITIDITADSTAESAETFGVRLSQPVDATLGGDAAATVTVTDDGGVSPEAGGVTVSPASLALTELGSSSTVEKTYTVVLDTDPGADVTITATNGDATAVEVDTDSGTSGNQSMLTFTAGGDGSGSGAGNGNWAVAQTVTVRALNDADAAAESFNITHAATAASGAYNGITVTPVAVTTTDAGHGVVVSKSSLSVAENDETDTYTVVLKSRPSGNVVISATSGATARATVSPGTLTFSNSDWNTPKTFTVTGKGAGSTSISHAVQSSADTTNYPTSTTISAVSVTVTAAAGVDVALSASDGDSDGNVVEGGSGAAGYKTITVTLGRALAGSEQIAMALDVAGATATTDYSLALQPATQTGVTASGSPSGSTVTFGAGVRTATLRFTPVDNDIRSQPAISISVGTPTPSGVTVGEVSGGPVVFSIVDDETGAVVVPPDWALKPSGLGGGDTFRLIFITSETRTAESTDIDDYNTWARGVVARGGHANLLPYGGLVTVIGSTASTDARENTGMWDPSLNSGSGGHADGSTSDSDPGTKVYWLAAPPRHKVADNYHEFYGSNGWDGGHDQSGTDTTESGASRTSGASIWTGTTTDGTDDGDSLGSPGNVNIGYANSGHVNSLYEGGATPRAGFRPMFGISPVFEVEAATPEISMALQTGETSNRNTAGQLELNEAGGAVGATFDLSADGVLASALTVCLNVAEAGGDLLAASAEGIKTATLTSGGSANGAGIYALTWTGDGDDERDSVVTATLVAPNTVGCSAAAGSYTVSSAMASDAVRIEDDDATAVSLTSSDTQMAEGDASDTAALTVTLGRRLHADEVVVVPFTLATTTGARLPGHMTPDFAVSASGTGVTIGRANTATPSLTFTGDNVNTVRTATVTLTPVANRDDGDGDHEEITATLASDSVLGSTMGSGTTVGGGAMRHGTNYEVDLTLEDDDAPAATPELTFASAAHSVAEDAGTVDVTVNAAPAPGNALTVNLSSRSGTAGLNDYAKPPATFTFPANRTSHTVSVTVRDDGLHEDDETFTLTLGAASDASYTLGSPATTTVTIASDDPPPPPVVSAHPKDAVGVEGAAGSASVELRLSRALESGETLTVDYGIDLALDAVAESHDGVSATGIAADGATTGTVTITGPNAPRSITLELSPAAGTVDASVSGSRAAEFRLTGVAGVDGASLSGMGSAKVFVNDANVERSTSIRVSGGTQLGRRQFEEGGEVWLLLDGRAGKARNAGARRHDWYNATVGVQHLTTGFDDLGEAYAGHDATVGHLGREGDTDYYTVGVLGYGHSAQVRIPVLDDGADEGDERFRVFIAETPGNISRYTGTRTSYMGVGGAYNALDGAPGIDFTIKGQTGGPQRSPSEAPSPPQAPTQAVSNVQVTAVDANNARAAWDAVEHATGYEVAWDALDGGGQSIAGGLSTGVAGTSETIAHHAPGAASLEVTVAPQYVDGNGDTQTLDGLAGTATLDLGSTGNGAGNGDSVGDGGTGGGDSGAGDPTPASSCVGDAQWRTVAGYYKSNAGKAPKYGSNWYRVLIAYRLEDADRALPAWTGPAAEPTTAYTVKEAEDGEKVWSGWTPVRKVLECLRDAKLVSRSFVPLVPAASNPAREGVVRIANRSARAGSVRIAATDDAGWRPEPLTLPLDAGAAVALTSADLEQGNEGKGLSGGTGPGTGDWRLDVSSDLDLGVRPFVRAADGAAAAMHGVAEETDGVHAVWTFNPAGELAQSSLLRVVNLGAEPATVGITGVDDAGAPGGAVALELPARAAVQLTAADLEAGGPGIDGRLGDGRGRWRLRVASAGELAVMNLAVSPFGHLTNLSGGGFPALRGGRAHPVPHFPPASDGLGRLGLVRVVNESARGGEVRVLAHDAAGRRHGPLTLRLGPGGAAQFDSWDLEFGGAAGGGLTGSTGPGVGAWRLEVTSGLDIVVRAYVATPAGSLRTAREFLAGPGPLRWGEAFAEDR